MVVRRPAADTGRWVVPLASHRSPDRGSSAGAPTRTTSAGVVVTWSTVMADKTVLVDTRDLLATADPLHAA